MSEFDDEFGDDDWGEDAMAQISALEEHAASPQKQQPEAAAPEAEVEVPKCNGHSEPCVERTVQKEGANQGRPFFVCARAREDQCQTFIWADAPEAQKQQQEQALKRPLETDADPPPNCTGHDEPCMQRVVQKEGDNKGRPFYVCGRTRDTQCNTFIWADEKEAPADTASSPKKAKPNEDIPKCVGHDAPCVERTVAKEGANKGRVFYACSQAREVQCKTFIWADEQNGAQPAPAGSPTKKASNAADEIPNCNGHSKPCAQRTVAKEGANKGRVFYTCAEPRDTQCKTFIWADEAATSNQAGNNSTTQSPGKGTCYKCGKPGHWASQCPQK